MKKINNNRGVAMVAVLTIMFVAAVLSVALFTYSSEQLMQARRNQDEMQAKYLSRTGVEAALAAYTELDASYTSGTYTHTAPLKLTTTYTYLIDDSGSLKYKAYEPSDPSTLPTSSERVQGFYSVTVTYPVEETANGATFDVVSFSCTATSGGQTTVATATGIPTNTGGITTTSEAYIATSTSGAKNAGPKTPTGDGTDNLDWYDTTGTVNTSKSTKSYPISVQDDSNTFHEFTYEGVVNFNSPSISSGVSLDFDALDDKNNNNKVGFFAEKLYMNMPIDLAPYTNGVLQLLVLGAGDIVINEPVTIELTDSVFSLSRGGALAVAVPEDVAVIDPVSNEKCGKIYFNADVYLRADYPIWQHDNVTIFEKGTVYYFKMKSGVTDNLNQVNLVKYWCEHIYDKSIHGDHDKLVNEINDQYGSGDQYAPDDMRMVDITTTDTSADLVPPNAIDSSYLVWK